MLLITRTPVRRVSQCCLALLVAALVLTSCGWRGIANLPVPGGAGSGPNAYTIYVQMPETLALNVNSRVRVGDVEVGKVNAIELQNWVAILTLAIEPGVRLPANATAKIGQTSLLGSQHVELAAPPDPSPQPLRDGDTIPLTNASAFPTTERVLASLSLILRGGGIPDLEVIQDEVYNVLNGRADQIRDFLTKLDTFTKQLNQQTEDITRAIESTNRLLTYVANQSDTLDRVLTELPPLIEHFADTRDQFVDAWTALGRIGTAADAALAPSSDNLHTNLQLLQRPLTQLERASSNLVGALKLILTIPFTVDSAPKVVRGDYVNVSVTIDLTLSALDNGLFSGTGISGMLRALEQSWGRDPNTMLPDVRYTPNPNDVPGGPYVERGE